MNESEKVELRVAEASDAPAMLQVIHEAFGARPAVDPPAAALSDTVADIEQRLRQAPGILALRDGQVIGCLLTSIDGPVGRLHRVSVRPSARTRGVAAQMVRGAGDVFGELGVRCVELLCRKEFPETRRWWVEHGFSQVGLTDQGWVMGIELPAIIEVSTGEAMQDLGRRLALLLRAGDVVVASGDLGAGKTTLTQGIGAGLGVEGPVISPTFVLSRVHHNLGEGPDLVHVDAYRLGSETELFDLDLDQTLPEAVTLVEWGAGLAEGLSSSVLQIDIRRSLDPDDETRQVFLQGMGERWQGIDLHQLAEQEDEG
ncbi:hypothetical protein GCM10027030_04120 [Luteococcus sediminum]